MLRQLLEKNVTQIEPVQANVTAFEALRQPEEKKIGALIVMDGEKPIGIMSERYTRKVILEGKSSQTTKVRDIISSLLLSVRPEDTVE